MSNPEENAVCGVGHLLADVARLAGEMTVAEPEPAVIREKIAALTAEVEKLKASSVPEARAANKGGRPPKYDWDAFTRELIRIANLDGLPTGRSGGVDRAAIQRQMLNWCAENWLDMPAESVVRERLSKILPD
jgi:hypothetical protein